MGPNEGRHFSDRGGDEDVLLHLPGMLWALFGSRLGGIGDAGSSLGSTLRGFGGSWERVWIPTDFDRFPGSVQDPKSAGSWRLVGGLVGLTSYPRPATAGQQFASKQIGRGC